MIRGRPIRFLAGVVGGWTVMRLAMVLPLPVNLLAPSAQFAGGQPASAPAGVNWMFPRQRVGPVSGKTTVFLSPLSHGRPEGLRLAQAMFATAVVRPDVAVRYALPEPVSVLPDDSSWSFTTGDTPPAAQLAYTHTPQAPFALASFAPGMGLSLGEAGAPVPRLATTGAGSWSGGAWLLWRQDGDPGWARLGGAQAGARVDYRLARSSFRPAVYARVSSALHGIAAAEVAAGIAIRPPLPFPVTIAVERREAVSSGGRSDFAVLAAGGIDPVEVGLGLRLDGYGQAGIVGVDRRDAFADGRLTLERPVAGAVAIGAAIWGGAQPGVSRLDIGPEASVRLRLGGANMRFGAEWRARVAGNAAPSSGPALSFGTDF